MKNVFDSKKSRNLQYVGNCSYFLPFFFLGWSYSNTLPHSTDVENTMLFQKISQYREMDIQKAETVAVFKLLILEPFCVSYSFNQKYFCRKIYYYYQVTSLQNC